uniref:Uncharacterized protein n=1 Tax=Quercus lobata TaxID=97700 RepID=A0A7N2L6U4_QUELO
MFLKMEGWHAYPLKVIKGNASIFDYYKGNASITDDVFATLGLKIHGGKNVHYVWDIFMVLVLGRYSINSREIHNESSK